MIPQAERKRMPGKVQIMSNRPTQEDWTKPAAMAIPEGGYFKDKVENGRYGPIFPMTSACYIAKVIPGKEQIIANHAKAVEKAIADDPAALAVLNAHYLRWLVFKIKRGELLYVPGHLRYRFR